MVIAQTHQQLNYKSNDKLTKKSRFSLLFKKHYQRLYRYAYKTLNDESLSEEIVQETFIKLWENFDTVKKAENSIESFLIVTLKNKIIDNFRKTKTRTKHTDLYTQNANFKDEIDTQWEVLKQIDLVYKSIDPAITETFRLSRDQGLIYKEIAAQKNISIKTVELHISKALKAFKKGLSEFL